VTTDRPITRVVHMAAGEKQFNLKAGTAKFIAQ
jgi:hypothetical protein